MHRAGLGTGPHEVPMLEALGEQAHAISAPPQHLDAITLAASEDEHVAAERISFERGLNGGRQAVKPPAHIRYPSSQPDSRACWQPHHCSDSIIVRSTVAEHGPSSKIVPLGRRICKRPSSDWPSCGARDTTSS